MKTV
ncbi:hypothetical protein CPC197_1108A, partial [Chlamydia psittaci C1/97]|jgi:hypothetical protein